jgi:hypothetical protein
MSITFLIRSGFAMDEPPNFNIRMINQVFICFYKQKKCLSLMLRKARILKAFRLNPVGVG